MLQYFTIIGMIICGLSSIKHHCGNALCFVIQTSSHMFIRMTEVYPGSQVNFLALSLSESNLKGIISKPETNCSPFTLVTLHVHASTAHTLATKMHCLITWQVPSNSFSEPFPQHSMYYAEYLKTVNRYCHLFSSLRSCLFMYLCLWRSDLSVCSSLSSLQFSVHIFLETWHSKLAKPI